MFNKIIQKLMEPFREKIISDLMKIYQKYKDDKLKDLTETQFIERYINE